MFCPLAILWVLSCRGRRYPVSATPTHMLRICVNSHDDPLLSRGEHCSPAKKYKVTFLLFALFTDEKRGKSHLRGFSILLKIFFRVHELVARAMRGECVRHGLMVQVSSFAALRNLILPRVRTYHTKKPSRFVHALSARPHNRVGGRGWSPCADGTIKINPISPCSHPDTHPNSNREVRHSLTWHSSKSESALERFEPVAVVRL